MTSHANPLSLVQRAYRGICLAYTGLWAPVIILLPVKLRNLLLTPHSGRPVLLTFDFVCVLLVFMPYLIGTRIYFHAVREFDLGQKQQRWTREEIETAHAWISSPTLAQMQRLFRWVSLSVLVPFFWIWRHSSAVQLTTDLFILLSWYFAPGAKVVALRKRVAPEPPPKQDSWQSTVRLHSEYWGLKDPAAGGAQS